MSSRLLGLPNEVFFLSEAIIVRSLAMSGNNVCPMSTMLDSYILS